MADFQWNIPLRGSAPLPQAVPTNPGAVYNEQASPVVLTNDDILRITGQTNDMVAPGPQDNVDILNPWGRGGPTRSYASPTRIAPNILPPDGEFGPGLITGTGKIIAGGAATPFRSAAAYVSELPGRILDATPIGGKTRSRKAAEDVSAFITEGKKDWQTGTAGARKTLLDMLSLEESGSTPTAAVATPPGTAAVASAATPAANPFAKFLPAEPTYTNEYKQLQPQYYAMYQKALETKNYNAAEAMTKDLYAQAKMTRPETGPGSAMAVAQDFEQVPKPSTPGTVGPGGSTTGGGPTSATPGTASSPTSPEQSIAKRMGFIRELTKQITKEFGFDPFNMDPEQEARKQAGLVTPYASTTKDADGNTIPFLSNRSPAFIASGRYEDVAGLTRKLAAAKANALSSLDFGLKEYDKMYPGVKAVNIGPDGTVLMKDDTVIGNYDPRKPIGLGDDAVFVPNRGLITVPKYVPLGENGAINQVTGQQAGGSSASNTTNRKFQITAPQFHANLIDTMTKVQTLAKRSGIPDKTINDVLMKATTMAQSGNVENAALTMSMALGSLMKTPEQQKVFHTLMDNIKKIPATVAAPQETYAAGNDGFMYRNGQKTSMSVDEYMRKNIATAK